jgi:hypothetical protein
MMDDGRVTEPREHPRRPRSLDPKRLGEVFGDVLPETTSDERDPERRRESGSDSWYEENRPPHHEDR